MSTFQEGESGTCRADGLAKASSTSTGDYDWHGIEDRWQAVWRDRDVFKAPLLPDGSKGKYVFAACPFTSGNAHMGHIRSYSIADSYARFLRARGEPVLFSMGFDSFGLPAELGAIRNGIHPREWVDMCYRAMRDQFDRMGFSVDWERTFISSDKDMYLWSQWLFVNLLERGLVYEQEGRVDWCESCNTVLARSQVEDECCWRCGDPVQLVNNTQWFRRASAYFAENDERLDQLTGWDKNSLGAQRAVLGRSDGVELEAETIDGRSISVFASSLEAVASAAFIAASPSCPEIESWIADEETRKRIGSLRTSSLARSDRKPEQTEVVHTDIQMIVPGVPQTVPLVISPYVDTRFGSTVIVGIPEEDATARAIADGLREQVMLSMPVNKRGTVARPAVRFAAADFPISRQRAWGAPIPLVNCEACGCVPVPLEQLPVELPDDLRFTGVGNPLAEHAGFAHCCCPSCGGPARRETDTLDCHVDGVWMWMPICVPQIDRSREMFTHLEYRRWIPVHQIVWGMDGGAYILSQRTLAKMLRDYGMLEHLPDGEPFDRALMHGMVEQGGRKMSKHLGNVVEPQDLIQRVGADTVRLAALHGAAPRNGMSWSEREVAFCHRFLNRLWDYTQSHREMLELGRAGGDIDRSDKLRRRLAKWCDVAIKKITTDMSDMQIHRAARNLILLLTRIEDFEQRVIDQRGALGDEDREALGIALSWLIQMLAPLTPHIAEELWSLAGSDNLVIESAWPVATGLAGVGVEL